MNLKTAVIYGSVRRDRQGIKAARFVVKNLEERGHEVTLVDPLEYPHPMLDLRYREYDDGAAPEVMQQVAGILANADGFVIVSGEYNHGIPPALKNLLDHYGGFYQRKPSGMVTYSAGPFAGAHVRLPLRETLSALGTIPIPAVFGISKIGESFDDDGNAVDIAYETRVTRFLDEYEWYANALQTARATDDQADATR